MESVAESSEVGGKLARLRDNLNRAIFGKSDLVEQVVIALVAGGSILIEDVPGVGKTTLAKALAASVELDFQRVQCTPDLLPSDIFGFSVFHPGQGSFEFRPGPVFTNVLLVDEINRASPRTQSALLEAMAERQVSIEGDRRPLAAPFMVLATQNPLGFQGTYPLPESQLDRFLFLLSMDYPDAATEVDILYAHARPEGSQGPLDDLQQVLTRDEVLLCQQMAQQVQVERMVAEYLVEIVRRTRSDARLRLGCSPRGSLMLFRASQAAALVRQRDYVTPDDVQHVAPLTLSHRVAAVQADAGEALQRTIIEDILSQVDVPV